MQAIDVLKDKIKEKGGDLGDKEFNKIMLSHGSKMGLDPKKGEKTQSRTKVMDKIKIKGAKKGEVGRVGSGRFNRSFAMEKEKKMSGMTDKEFNKNRQRGGFKSDRGPPRGGEQRGGGFKRGGDRGAFGSGARGGFGGNRGGNRGGSRGGDRGGSRGGNRGGDRGRNRGRK
jgi:hypothetical protein